MRAGGLARIHPKSGWVGKSQPELCRAGSGLNPLAFGSGWASPFKAGWPEIPALERGIYKASSLFRAFSKCGYV